MASKEQYWTESKTEMLVKLYKQGIPYKEIAKRINRSVSALQTQIHNIKLKVDRISRKIYNES